MRQTGFRPATISRRELLSRGAHGFGGLALTAMLAEEARSAPRDPFAPRPPHYSAPAKSVIFLYMDGGPAQMDTFDPKPQLDKEHGQRFKMKVQPTQFAAVGNVLKSPWKFERHGESGLPYSELFPHLATRADDLCFVRSMTSAFSEHTNANYFLHTGHGLQGRPCMGSWITYGLGSECRDLPGFVVLNGGLTPPGGADCFHSGFLPASYQGSVFRGSGTPVADLDRTEATDRAQLRKLDLVRALDRQAADRTGRDDALESAIANHELAFRMQAAVPEAMDLSRESQAVQKLYGLDHPNATTKGYARQCLAARRLVERGVRFVLLTCPNVGADRWDQHANLKDGHERNALAVDRPVAGLLEDLASRGLLRETLVVWAGEFGRTPMAQGANGRDHNPFGFTVWLAGGGIRGGSTYGATDEYGYYAVENKLQIHDLHATMLHALGLDHTRLTYRFSSRDMRLTDVHGRVVREIFA